MPTEQLRNTATNVSRTCAETLSTLSMTRLDAVQQLTELNLQTLRAALEQGAQTSRDTLSSNNPQDWFTLPLQAFQANVEKMSNYLGQTAKIMADTQHALVQAVQRQADKAQQQFKPMLESNLSNLPDNGAQPLTGLFNQMLSNANQFYGTLQQLSKTAADASQSRLRSLDGAAAPAPGSKSGGGRRAAAA